MRVIRRPQLAFPFCQRWAHRRASYRPAGEPIDTTQYGVEETDRLIAKAFVQDNHYAGTFPAARLSIGVFRRRRGGFHSPDLVGAAVFSVPMHNSTVTKYTGLPPDAGVLLGRFVLRQDVEANGETWVLARAFTLLHARFPAIKAVVSYSDPVPRPNAAGDLTMPGHYGAIYKAHNGIYCGRGSPRTMLLTRQGTEFSPRALSKLRNGERGEDYALKQLLDLGAPPPRLTEGRAQYVDRILRSGLFAQVAHPGCHVYVWPIGAPLERARSRAAWRTDLLAPVRPDPVPQVRWA